MGKDIIDYLPYYFGCWVIVKTKDATFQAILKGIYLDRWGNFHPEISIQVLMEHGGFYTYKLSEVTLYLRPLSDMTEEERNWFFKSIRQPGEEIETAEWVTERNRKPCVPEWVLWVKDHRIKHGYTIGINMHFTAEQFRYLLSKGFDLFNLYKEGLCLYKSDLK